MKLPRWVKIALLLLGAIPTVLAAFGGFIQALQSYSRAKAISKATNEHIVDLQENITALKATVAAADADAHQAKHAVTLMREHMDGYLAGLNARRPGKHRRDLLRAEVAGLKAKVNARPAAAQAPKYAPPSNLPKMRRPRKYDDVIEQKKAP